MAAVLAVVGAVVAWILGLTPNPFDDTEPKGSVEIEETVRNQTLAMFIDDAGEPQPGDVLGLTLYVTRSGDHVDKDGCRLEWTFLNADVPAPVSDPRLRSQPAQHVAPHPRSCVTQTRLWVPLAPSLEGYENVAVRVELYAGDHLLDSDVSQAIPLG